MGQISVTGNCLEQKLEKGPVRDYETAFCLLLAHMVLENKIFKD
jgi:hypothetical protein